MASLARLTHHGMIRLGSDLRLTLAERLAHAIARSVNPSRRSPHAAWCARVVRRAAAPA